MKRSSFLFLSFLAFLLAQGFTGQAQAPGIEKLYTLDKEANLSYNISNDDRALIVAIKVTDAAQQMKLARNGLEIWIDPKGKKNKKTGVHYPLAETAGDHPNSQMPQDFGISDTGVVFLRKQAARTLASKKEAEMVGFKATFNGKKSSDDTTGISIATDFTDKQTLYYSVRIPFDAFAQPLDVSHALSVGIIIKGMQFPGGGPDGPGGGGPGGEGGLGGGGGGGEMGPPPGGGPGGPDGDDMQKLFADDIVWQKISIKGR